MILVKAQLKINILQYHQADRYPGGQSKNVDKGVQFSFPEVPEGEDEVIFEHRIRIF
jgi:hypothetical protein